MTLAPNSVIWQIVGISLVMFVFTQWFSRRFKVSQQSQMQTQMRLQDLQDQLKLAQQENNHQLIAQVNAEMAQLMRDMSKNQIVPMCIRTVVFFAIWGLMNLLYGKYDEFLPFNFIFGRSLFSLYLLVSFSCSALLIVGRLIYRKLYPEKQKKEEVVYDKLRALQSNVIVNQNHKDEDSSSLPTKIQNDRSFSAPKKEKGWKERL